jgi:hypothetical protein
MAAAGMGWAGSPGSIGCPVTQTQNEWRMRPEGEAVVKMKLRGGSVWMSEREADG